MNLIASFEDNIIQRVRHLLEFMDMRGVPVYAICGSILNEVTVSYGIFQALCDTVGDDYFEWDDDRGCYKSMCYYEDEEIGLDVVYYVYVVDDVGRLEYSMRMTRDDHEGISNIYQSIYN